MELQKEERNDESHVKIGFVEFIFFLHKYFFRSNIGSFKRCHLQITFYSHNFIHHVILFTLVIKKLLLNNLIFM